MPTFDLVVVGSGGGPSEVNISGYLLKSCESSWKDGIIGLEAGSGFGALKQILQRKPDLFSSPGDVDGGLGYDAARIYSYVRTFLVSHAHLDHIMGLILLAGGVGGQRKSIRGSRQCLEDLETIFRPNRIWPNLASWHKCDSDFMYLYDPLLPDNNYSHIYGDVSVRMMPISHGSNPVPYLSSAFFIRHDPSKREFLFFGDVEPDSVASIPQTIEVWRAAAPKIPDFLDTIFIECSWPSGRADKSLYGHLTPEHLVQELLNLAMEVVRCRNVSISKKPPSSGTGSPSRKRQKRPEFTSEDLHGALSGVRVYITHCKEDMESKYDRPMHEVITEQVSKLAEKKRLGALIFAAEQGTHIGI